MSSAKWTVGSVSELVSRIRSRKDEELWMRGVEISDRNIAIVANALIENPSLEELWLSDCEISDVGAQEIARFLSHPNCSLRFLNLSGNNISGTGATVIFEALEQNKCLQSIFLNSNKIGDEGASAVAKFLSKNVWLRELYLWDNGVTDNGAQLIADGLLFNKVLTKCELDNGDEDETNYVNDKTILHTIEVYCARNLVNARVRLAHRDSSTYRRVEDVQKDFEKV